MPSFVIFRIQGVSETEERKIMGKARLRVYGMDCPSCSSSVERIVKRSANVTSVKCNYLDGSLLIEYPGSVDFSQLEKKLRSYGYRIPEDRIHVTLPDDGKALKGEFLSSFEGATGWKEEEGETVLSVIRTGDSEGKISSFFSSHGIDSVIVETESGEESIEGDIQVELLESLVISLLLTLPLLWGPEPVIQFILSSLIQIFPARRFYRGMVRSVRSGSLNMDVLTALSTSVIYLFSSYTAFTRKEDIKLYFLCQGVLVTMVLFGRYLESVMKGETTRSLRKLLSIIPRRAKVMGGDRKICEKDISEISKKERIVLEKGERIPLDCILDDGFCVVDESVMTGESDLVEKKKGDTLVSGTVLRDGRAVAEVVSTAGDSAIERVVEIVRNAESSITPERKTADRIAGVFIPSVIVISLGVFLLWYFVLTPGNVENALVTASGVLVVACPCALSLAIPTSIMVGSGRAAEMGLLFKSPSVFSLMGKIDTIAIDKTGTLTSGSMDEVRPEAADFVSSMKRRGLDIILISGDTEAKARRAAENVGIERIFYGVKSEEKAAIISSLSDEGHFVLMIGDGVNDAPAMAVSTVGISIENGTEIAKDTADIIVLGDDLEKIEDVFIVSEAVERNIKVNLIWALVYNLVAIPLSAAGLMNPSIASAAMSFSSVAVLLNSLKLRNIGRRGKLT